MTFAFITAPCVKANPPFGLEPEATSLTSMGIIRFQSLISLVFKKPFLMAAP
jgi:hypothetical protein